METLTHLKTSTAFLENQNKSYSQQVVEKFIESCLKLDALIFEPYMDENDVFEDLEKYKFLAELKDLFEYSRFQTDYRFSVRMTEEVCRGCEKDKPVFHFEVQFSGSKIPVGDFGYLIDQENGILKDIYRCNMYKECHGNWIEPPGLSAIRVPNAGNKIQSK
jgi:hypothetical protein